MLSLAKGKGTGDGKIWMKIKVSLKSVEMLWENNLIIQWCGPEASTDLGLNTLGAKNPNSKQYSISHWRLQ